MERTLKVAIKLKLNSNAEEINTSEVFINNKITRSRS